MVMTQTEWSIATRKSVQFSLGQLPRVPAIYLLRQLVLWEFITRHHIPFQSSDPSLPMLLFRPPPLSSSCPSPLLKSPTYQPSPSRSHHLSPPQPSCKSMYSHTY